MPSPDNETLSFVTLLSWPEGRGFDDLIRSIDGAGLADARTLDARLKRPPPLILAESDPELSAWAAETVTSLGGDAFAPTLESIEALGPTLKIKDLRIDQGAVGLDLWRGGTVSIALDQIQVLVRATVRASRKITRTDTPRTLDIDIVHAPGSYGRVKDEIRASRTTSTTTSEKLDIHLTGGSVLQLDGDKFGYSALGGLKGGSDKSNMDRMLELLSHLAPQAITDECFRLFRPPNGIRRFRIEDMRLNNDDPAFAFYSRWSAQVYRYAMGVLS